MGVMGIEQKPWSYADDAKLRELWETTPSSKLAAIFGRSRNAVIGRAHRMKLPPKRFRSGNKTKSAPKLDKESRAPRRTTQPSARLAVESAEAIQFRRNRSSQNVADAGEGSPAQRPQPSPVALPVPLLELTARSCRYIVEGEGEFALFCNASRLDHGPYCPSHAARCYTAPERRRAA